MAAIAIVLAIVLVAVLVASRVALRPQATFVPGGKGGVPNGVAIAAPDSYPCSLAVSMFNEASGRGQTPLMTRTLGFLNIPSGDFAADPTASAGDLPSDASSGFTYSALLKRWIPAQAYMISPDGRAYLYVRLLPQGQTNWSDYTSSELHLYDVEKNVDRKLWSQPQYIEVVLWGASGILAYATPFKGGTRLLWRVDPATGSASQASRQDDPNFQQMSLLPRSGSFGKLGSDGTRAVYRIGSRDKGAKYSIVVVASGKVTTLYEGTAGDATDFDPQVMRWDAHGLWLGNFDGSRVWLWTEVSGLRDFKITNAPPPAAGYQYSNVWFGPAGPCVPGVFAGVAPTGLPAAPTPSPSTTPPVIDWSTLTSKPLKLDSLPAGASCPVSSKVDLAVKGQSGKWPNYGFGDGPAYLSAQFMWYSDGPQAAIILVDPKYKGPVLVRTKRLDGPGTLTLSGEGATALGDGSIGLAQTSSPPYWGTWLGPLTTNVPGCYGIQFDGTSFTSMAVISVKTGPPPPG
jgi:hypothetical protein